jgi:hypothetical protein
LTSAFLFRIFTPSNLFTKKKQAMKTKLLFLLLTCVMSVVAYAQPHQAFNYQAVVRDDSGNLISNHAVSVLISIINGYESGPVIYQETHLVNTNDFGMISLAVGEGTPVAGYDFENVDWSDYFKFIEVEIDPAGGTNYTSMGISELLSVPYALYSERSMDSYWENTSNNIYYPVGNVGIGTTTPDTRMVIKTSGAGDVLKILSNTDNTLAKFRHTGNNSGALYLYDGANNNTVFLYGDGNSFINSGSFGIGTASPSNAKLQIEGTGTYDAMLRLNNLGTNGASFFLGSTNSAWGGGVNENLFVMGHGAPASANIDLCVNNLGNFGIGTTTLASGYRLSVDGKVACEEVLVELSGSWPDYVFKEGYQLTSLEKLEKEIRKFKHLPGLPSAKEVEENGLKVGDMQKMLVEKLEELTLYTIEQDKMIRKLKRELGDLKLEVRKMQDN